MKTLKYILLSCVVLGAVACDDFLVETPDTSVEKSGVYNSLSSAKAALAGCYGNMAGYNGIIIKKLGIRVYLVSNIFLSYQFNIFLILFY